jgi:glycosyltransferase involved in cell wall biosynthesis
VKTLHVAQFTDAYRPVVDGVVGVVTNYATMIHRHHGHAVVVAPEQRNAPLDDPYPVLRFPSIPLSRAQDYRLSVTPELAVSNMRRLTETPIDIIHAHSPFRIGELAIKIGHLKKIPVICTFHSRYKDDFLSVTGSRILSDFGVEHLVRRFWNRVPYVMVPTEFSGRVLRSYGWEGEYRIQPNGTDMRLPSADEMEKYRVEGGRLLDVPPDMPVLLFVGQHRWVKNPAQVIDTAAILKHHGIRFLQVFIGGGRDEDEIIRYAENSGAADRIRFVGLVRDREVLSRYYARADLFTFPSTYDVDPLVVKEAAAWGTPSIVARDSSPSERIVDGKNGFVTPPDPGATAALIQDILKSPGRAALVGEEARRTVYLSRETVVNSLVDSYREIIEEWREKSWQRNLAGIPSIPGSQKGERRGRRWIQVKRRPPTGR